MATGRIYGWTSCSVIAYNRPCTVMRCISCMIIQLYSHLWRVFMLKMSDVTERFEVFINGAELGNGYFELADAQEQEARFEREIAARRALGLDVVAKDFRLLAALRAGLPDCCGVALGLDRLLMILAERKNIADVIAFPIAIA